MSKKFNKIQFFAIYKQRLNKEILLFSAAILAILISNSSFSSYYQHFLTREIGISYDGHIMSMQANDWINDLFMAFFFLIVGIEIKRETITGHLSTWKQRSLPLIAAMGGVALPSVLYIAINSNDLTAMKGWAIPSATDIAFTLGALSIFGKRIPISLKVFVTALAIIDDLIAVIIIALFYNNSIHIEFLIYSLFVVLALWLCNKKQVKSIQLYLFLGFVLWVCILLSGIHATIAGVIFGILLPIKENNTIALTIEKCLTNFVGYIVLPLFAFVNSGVNLQGMTIDPFASITLGIFCGLFFGKQIGIFLSAKLAIALGIGQMPNKTSSGQLYAASVLCGIGFTMSLFVALLAFANSDDYMLNQAKIGIFTGSIASLCFGLIILKLINKK